MNREPVIARTPSRFYQFQKAVRRHWFGFTAATAFLVALSTGVLVSTLELGRARRTEREGTRLERQAERDAKRARLAEADALAKVRDSYLAQAQAGRWSHRAGRRFRGLALLKKAAEICPGTDLRNEAIACLALTDLRQVAEWNAYPSEGIFGGFDASYSRYAYADKTGRIYVRPVESEASLWEFDNSLSPLAHLHFSRSGSLLLAASGGESSRVEVFDVDHKTSVLKSDGPRFRTFDISLNGKHLALSYEQESSNWPIRIIELSTGRVLASFAHGSLPYHIQFDPKNSHRLLSSDAGTVVRIWDWTSGTIVQRFVHPNWVMGIDWHPEANLVATACADNLIRFWDIATGLERSKLQGSEWTPTEVSFSAPSGKYLASHGWDGVLRIWDPQTQSLLVDQPIFGALYPFSRSDDRFACTMDWGRIAILDVAAGYGYGVLQPNAGPDRGVSCDFSPDGRWLISTHSESLCLLDLTTSQEVAVIPERRGDLLATFLPEGTDFCLSGLNVVETWRINPRFTNGVASMQFQSRFEGRSALSRPRHATPSRMLTYNPDGLLSVLDPLTGGAENKFRRPRGVEFAALSPDARFAAIWNRFNKSLPVWDITTSNLVREVPAHPSIVAEFSSNGRYLIVGDDVEYRVWDVPTWESLYAIRRSIGGSWGYLAITQDSQIAAVAVSAIP